MQMILQCQIETKKDKLKIAVSSYIKSMITLQGDIHLSDYTDYFLK